MTLPVASVPEPANAPFLHPQALVDAGAVVGPRTRVWAFAHLAAGARVGADCNVCDHTFVEGGVTVGDRVTLKCGVYLWSGVSVEDDVFIGPAVVFTNDLRPRSKQYPPEFLPTRLRQGCSLGAGAILLPGLTIGRWAMVGAGSVVTQDVPDHALVLGNPARFRSWICQCGAKLVFTESTVRCACGRTFGLSATGPQEDLACR